jgi:hypothetical protein
MAHDPTNLSPHEGGSSLVDPFLQTFKDRNQQYTDFGGSTFQTDPLTTGTLGGEGQYAPSPSVSSPNVLNGSSLLPGETSEQFFGRLGLPPAQQIQPDQMDLSVGFQPTAPGIIRDLRDDAPGGRVAPRSSKVTLEGPDASFDPNIPGGITSLFSGDQNFLTRAGPPSYAQFSAITTEDAQAAADKAAREAQAARVAAERNEFQSIAEQLGLEMHVTPADRVVLSGEGGPEYGPVAFPVLPGESPEAYMTRIRNTSLYTRLFGGTAGGTLSTDPNIAPIKDSPKDSILVDDPTVRNPAAPKYDEPGGPINPNIVRDPVRQPGGTFTEPGRNIDITGPPTLSEAAKVNVPDDPRVTDLVRRFTEGLVSPEQRRILESQLITQVQEGSASRRRDLANRLGGAGVFGGVAQGELGRIFGESERGLATGLAGIQSNILNKNIEGQTQALETLFGLQGLSSAEAQEAARLITQANIAQGSLDLGTSRLNLDQELGRGGLGLERDRLAQEAEQEAARLALTTEIERGSLDLGRGGLELKREQLEEAIRAETDFQRREDLQRELNELISRGRLELDTNRLQNEQNRLDLQRDLGFARLEMEKITNDLNNQLAQGRLDLDTAALDFRVALGQQGNTIVREQMAQDFIQFLLGIMSSVDADTKDRISELLLTLGSGLGPGDDNGI